MNLKKIKNWVKKPKSQTYFKVNFAVLLIVA